MVIAYGVPSPKNLPSLPSNVVLNTSDGDYCISYLFHIDFLLRDSLMDINLKDATVTLVTNPKTH